MTPQRREAMFIVVMLVLLVGAVVWSAGWQAEQHEYARLAAADLADCEQLSEAIRSLQDKPMAMASEAAGVQQLGERTEAAFRKAKLSPDTLRGVYPQRARAVEGRPHLQKDSTLVLEDVTLSQFAVFLYNVTDTPGWSVRDLRIRTPRGEQAREHWDAEATITYLIYSSE